MSKVAIFGASGYLGRHLVRYLGGKGFECRGFDVNDDSGCDVTSADWWNTFNAEDFSAIVFLSGLSGPERSFQQAELYESVNVGGLLNLLKKLAPLGEKAPKIIFPSSRLVYRGGARVTEDSPLEPRSVYAANKVACEGLLSAYYHRFGIPYVALRLCVPYGNLISKDYSYGTVGFFMRQVMEGKPITVYGHGQCRKTYTHIADLCSIVHRVIRANNAIGVYNVGGHEYSLAEVAEMIVRTRPGKVEFVPWPDEAARVEMGEIALDASKLAEAIGFVEYRRMEKHVNDF